MLHPIKRPTTHPTESHATFRIRVPTKYSSIIAEFVLTRKRGEKRVLHDELPNPLFDSAIMSTAVPLSYIKKMKSPAKFGKKLKGFMAKKVTTDDDESRLLVADEPSVQVPVNVISQYISEIAEPTAVEISTPAVTAPSNQTNADRVFSKPAVAGSSKTNQTNADRVLTKIIKELKIGELAVHEMKSDEVSEFDGKSAPVLPGNTSEESEDDQVARRVDAVVAAAEEIRKKKNAEKSASWSVRRKKERETEATEGRDEEEDAVSSRASKQDEVEKVHSSNKSVKSKKSLKSVRKSQSLEKIVDTPEELKKEDSRSLSTFETSDDTFDMNNGSHTDLEDGDTVDMNTSEEEDTRTLRSMRNGKGKNTIMNKDVIIHVPGGPESLVVRKMYYSPVPKEPEEVIIEVEVSVPL